MQFPRTGLPTFKYTVMAFELFEDIEAFREHFAFDKKSNSQPHEAGWINLGDDI